MAKYKVVYDRKNCIGAGTCAAVQPRLWKMVDDKEYKAELINGKQIDKEKDIWELEFDDKELEAHIDGAKSCPVDVIRIIDRKTGKQIAP